MEIIIICILVALLLILFNTDGFSSLEYDISQGNSASYSGRPNIGGETWNRSPFLQDKDEMPFEPLTFHGQIPLSYETHRSYKGLKLNPESVFNKNPVCDPACCPSTYSCDHGCVCLYNK